MVILLWKVGTCHFKLAEAAKKCDITDNVNIVIGLISGSLAKDLALASL